VKLVEELPALGMAIEPLVGASANAAVVASAIELVLEGLHLADD